MNRGSRFLLGIVAILACNMALSQTKKVVADKIIGKVGDRIILKSDIANAIADIQRNGGEVPPNPDCMLMEAELIKKALVLQAEKDSLVVEEADIEAEIENRIRYFMRMYGGKEAVEEISGRSIYQMKEDFRKPLREQKLAEKMRGKILETVRITPVEVKEYYEDIPKDSLPYYESELEIGQVVVFPKADREIESYTAKQLNDIKKQIESGARRFDQMAKLYSEDPGSKDNGGQYTLNRADKFWDPVFLSTAFKLKEGQISNVVKSKFGLHIIQCVTRNGDDAVVRHILMIPPVTEDELNKTKEKLDSARSKLIAGTITWSEAISKYSDDEDKFSGGWLLGPDQSSMVTIDQVDKSMLPILKNLKPGQYSQPEVFANEQGKKGVRFIYLRTRTEPHRENLKEDYNKIATRALEEKKQNILSTWFSQKIGSYYIFLDPSYGTCEMLKPWMDASAKRNGK
ncbi:MAG TPA: peptidylprolyl isomerase [Phnomibacter sp.]|nr:peptidylprolyl isomerase [Phnomibacter sp.]